MRLDREYESNQVGWRPGEVIEFRNVLGGRTWCVVPVTVLADEPDFVAIRITAGSRWLAAVNSQGKRIGSWETTWRLREFEWVGQNCTYLLHPGTNCAIGYCMGNGVEKYYLNAQDPFVRFPYGLGTMDLELDMEIGADGCLARWKDIDRFRRLASARSIDVPTIVGDCLDAALLVSAAGVRARLTALASLQVPIAGLHELKNLPAYERMPSGGADES